MQQHYYCCHYYYYYCELTLYSLVRSSRLAHQLDGRKTYSIWKLWQKAKSVRRRRRKKLCEPSMKYDDEAHFYCSIKNGRYELCCTMLAINEIGVYMRCSLNHVDCSVKVCEEDNMRTATMKGMHWERARWFSFKDIFKTIITSTLLLAIIISKPQNMERRERVEDIN